MPPRYGLRPVSSRYSSTPSEYTSVATVTGSPRTCSGLALSGVSTRKAVRVRLPSIAARLQQLGDAEVEQLRHAVRGHEDVARLDVAMDDEVLVRILHRAAHPQEQRAAARGRTGAAPAQYPSIDSPSTCSMTT